MSEMTINPEDITSALKANLADWSPSIQTETIGYVTAIADGVARVKGLPATMASELLEFSGGLLGVALQIDEADLGVVLMGEYSHIEEGSPVKQTGDILSIPVGDAMLRQPSAACSRLRHPLLCSVSRLASPSKPVSRPLTA